VRFGLKPLSRFGLEVTPSRLLRFSPSAPVEVLRSGDQFVDARFDVIQSIRQRRQLLHGSFFRWLAASQSYTGRGAAGSIAAWFPLTTASTSSTSSTLWWARPVSACRASFEVECGLRSSSG